MRRLKKMQEESFSSTDLFGMNDLEDRLKKFCIDQSMDMPQFLLCISGRRIIRIVMKRRGHLRMRENIVWMSMELGIVLMGIGCCLPAILSRTRIIAFLMA